MTWFLPNGGNRKIKIINWFWAIDIKISWWNKIIGGLILNFLIQPLSRCLVIFLDKVYSLFFFFSFQMLLLVDKTLNLFSVIFVSSIICGEISVVGTMSRSIKKSELCGWFPSWYDAPSEDENPCNRRILKKCNIHGQEFFLEKGSKHLYPFWLLGYPTKIHLCARDSNLEHDR